MPRSAHEASVHRVGGLRVRSGTTLLLRSGAVLKASRDPADYDILVHDALEPVPTENFTLAVRHDPGDIVVRNCSLENVERFLHYNFSGNETWQRNRPLSSIRFEGVEAHGVGMSLCAYGAEDRPISLSLESCRIAFAGPQREFIRAAHVESLRLRDVEVEGVAGPCVRSWGGVAPVDAQGLSGVIPVIETADEPFHTQAI